MSEDGAHVAEAQRRHQPSAPERAQPGQEQYLPLPVPSYAFSVLGDPRLSGRGNGPVRAAVVQRMQRTVGNRATARLIQRLTTGRPLVAVQRDDDDEEEEQQANNQQDAQANLAPQLQQGRVRSAHQGPDNNNNNNDNNNNALSFAANDEEDIWANIEKDKNKDDDEDSVAGPLDDDNANPAQKIVAELELKVDVDVADLGVKGVLNGDVGHTWLSLMWLGSKKNVPNSIKGITGEQLKAKGYTSMGFWPLQFRAEDWTNNAKKERVERLKDWPKASPGRGSSTSQDDKGYAFWPYSEVNGRVEQPDISSHSAKAAYKYRLTEQNVGDLAAYVDSRRKAKYSLAYFNCTTFAVEAAQNAGQSPPSGVGKKGFTYPNALYDQLKEKLLNDDDKFDANKGYLKGYEAQ